MTLLKRSKPTLMLIFSLILGVLSASVAKADQPWKYIVRDHADEMIHISIDIRREVLHVAPSSRLLGEMLAEVGQMEANSAILKGWTYHREACHLREQAEKVHECVHHLEALVQEAQYRSDRGLDRRMSCSAELLRLIALMEATVTHTLDDIPLITHVPSQPAIVNRPVYVQPQLNYGGNNFRFQNTGPQFGSSTLQFGIGPRLKINVNLGGTGNRNTQSNHGHEVHQTGNRGHNSGLSVHQNSHVVSQKPAATRKVSAGPTFQGQGTNIYGGRNVVSQVAKSQSRSRQSSGKKNHAKHR